VGRGGCDDEGLEEDERVLMGARGVVGGGGGGVDEARVPTW
jgi:hypothetical protein